MKNVQPSVASRTKRAGVACGLFVLTLCISALAFSQEDKDKSQHCKTVSGSISASVTTIPNVVLGTVTGDLRGATAALITSPLPLPNGGNFTLKHTFVTEAGNSLRTEDMARWVRDPEAPNVFHMSTRYTIVGGTGKFDGATGRLVNHGEVDLNSGLLTLAYSGEVCTEK